MRNRCVLPGRVIVASASYSDTEHASAMETHPPATRPVQHQDFVPATVASHGQPVITNGDASRPLHLPSPTRQHDAVLSEVEEKLGSHDSLLEYIDSILMDETFEDRCWQQLVASTNGGRFTDRSDDLDGNISIKTMSSLSSDLDVRYQHIFRGFHQILADGQHDDHSVSPSVDADAASSDQVGEGLRKDWKEAIPEEFHRQQPESGGDVDAFMYNPASKRSMGQAASNFSMMGKHTPSVLSDQHNVNGQHIHPPIIMEALPDAHNNGMAVDAGAGHFHANVKSHNPQIPASGNVIKGNEDDVSLVRNADLPAELYAQLFDELSLRTSKASTFFGGGTSSTHSKKGSKEDAALRNPVDLKGLLLTSAKAAGEGNIKRAMEMLQQIQQQGANPYGTGLQRVVHYFSEALVVRLSGMGSTLYKALANTAQLPSPLMMIKVYKMVFEVCPYVKIGYHFANQYILKMASGASRLHIVDYGILYGFQWPCLIYALAHRPAGPPFIRITGIEFPANPADINPTATTDGTSHRLSEYARTYNVPFQYRAISASKWEDIDPSSLHISQDEVLVLNSFNRLGHLHDDSMGHPSSPCPRDQLLNRMRGLNPHLLVIGSVNATHSSPFFAPRFREAFHYYYNLFDALHTTLSSDSAERVVFERELMGRAILNVVACEGMERVEIPENYKQWQARIKRAGFQQLPIIPSVMSKARNVMRSYHKDFSLLNESNRWILLGWRGRCTQALCAWEPV